MKVGKVKQVSVFMPNRPGSMARLAELFASAGINILGIASEVSDDSGLVRIALDPAVDGAAVLSKAGFSSVETEILSVEVEDAPGEFRKVVSALADGKVNVTTVYGTSVTGTKSSRILVAVQGTEKALQILQDLAARAA